jgi:hypothetical protein
MARIRTIPATVRQAVRRLVERTRDRLGGPAAPETVTPSPEPEATAETTAPSSRPETTTETTAETTTETTTETTAETTTETTARSSETVAPSPEPETAPETTAPSSRTLPPGRTGSVGDRPRPEPVGEDLGPEPDSGELTDSVQGQGHRAHREVPTQIPGAPAGPAPASADTETNAYDPPASLRGLPGEHHPDCLSKHPEGRVVDGELIVKFHLCVGFECWWRYTQAPSRRYVLDRWVSGEDRPRAT